MSTTTYRELATRTGTDIQEHLLGLEDDIIPMAEGGYAIQGDVMVRRTGEPQGYQLDKVVDAAGVNLVAEDQGNRHFLSSSHTGVTISMFEGARGTNTIAAIEVPEGATAELVHTGEHGPWSFGPGHYEVDRQVDHATNELAAD